MMSYICSACPRNCHAVRGETGKGFCRMGADPVIARAAPHYDEEPVISGTNGSGAIFSAAVPCAAYSARTIQSPTTALVKSSAYSDSGGFTLN